MTRLMLPVRLLPFVAGRKAPAAPVVGPFASQGLLVLLSAGRAPERIARLRTAGAGAELPSSLRPRPLPA